MCAWSALILLALFVFFSFALPQALQVGGGRSSGFIRGYFFLASLALLFRGTKTQIHFCCCRVFFLSFFFTFPWVARMPCQTYVVAVTTKVRLSKRVRVRRFTLSKSFFFLHWVREKPNKRTHVVQHIQNFSLTEFILTGVYCIYTPRLPQAISLYLSSLEHQWGK